MTSAWVLVLLLASSAVAAGVFACWSRDRYAAEVGGYLKREFETNGLRAISRKLSRVGVDMWDESLIFAFALQPPVSAHKSEGQLGIRKIAALRRDIADHCSYVQVVFGIEHLLKIGYLVIEDSGPYLACDERLVYTVEPRLVSANPVFATA